MLEPSGLPGPGQGRESQPLQGLPDSAAPPPPPAPAFPPRRNHPGALRDPPTPTQVQALLSGCCPTESRTQSEG